MRNGYSIGIAWHGRESKRSLSLSEIKTYHPPSTQSIPVENFKRISTH